MPGIGNNLYPPIISTYMPAFVRNTACRIYFALSTYNNAEEIKNVQIVISNQNTNLSALKAQTYPAGIKIATLHKDEDRNSDDKYYVTIEPSDLQSGIFELNQYYKVQIRFTGTGATNLSNSNQIAKWLSDNQKFFSEWSTVCLIKGIEKPSLYLKGFGVTDGENIFTSEVLEFVGKMYYERDAEVEKEYLKLYRIKIYQVSSNKLVYDSGDVYTNVYNPNEINYTLKAALEDGITYQVVFSYTTVNDYTNSVSYTFSIMQNAGVDALNAKITATMENDLGRAKIDIISTDSEIFFGNLTIRRTSSKSNFTIWEDIHNTSIMGNKALNYTWYDYTIESGVWYKYCAQTRSITGDRGPVITIRRPIMTVFDDIFLTREDMQIRVRYNPQISSFKKTILESKTDTLGSKFPVIRRNGSVGYRQFSISGLITAFCDEEGVFINRESTYGDTITYYDNYNETNNIDEYQDFIYERRFREQVMDFLHANTIKLFRSTTEGNILVRLMDVSFTPNETLGRMLYTFNATAYEIDECSLVNFEKYGIQAVGDYNRHLKYTYSTLGQLQGTYNGEAQDVFKMLQKKYSDRSTEKFVNTVKFIKWLRLDFEMPPYLIKTAADGSIVPLPANERPTEDTALGYIVSINGKSIIVSSRGHYELTDDDTTITSVKFPVATTVTIDYIVEIDQIENISQFYKKIYINTKVGQIGDTFKVNENVFLKIYQKYLVDKTTYHQQLLSLNKVVIEAVPGTIVYVRDSFDDDYFKHEVGSTGVLEFFDPEAVVNGLYFGGIQLYEANEEYLDEPVVEIKDKILRESKEDALDMNNDNLKLNAKYFKIKGRTGVVETHDSIEVHDNEFRIMPEHPDSLADITHPVKNGIYTVDGKRYIFYHADWYEFSDDNVVQCPVDVLIDYVYEVMKGERY